MSFLNLYFFLSRSFELSRFAICRCCPTIFHLVYSKKSSKFSANQAQLYKKNFINAIWEGFGKFWKKKKNEAMWRNYSRDDNTWSENFLKTFWVNGAWQWEQKIKKKKNITQHPLMRNAFDNKSFIKNSFTLIIRI